jgi:hypothetical protein
VIRVVGGELLKSGISLIAVIPLYLILGRKRSGRRFPPGAKIWLYLLFELSPSSSSIRCRRAES